jgi:NAD-dependent deacetylase
MDDIARFGRLVREASRGVAFTGAGISTESGIPDYRGPQGVWNTETPVYYQDFMASRDARVRAWQRGVRMFHRCGSAKPNDGHLILTELQRRGHIATVITQNIDGLHQASGVPDARVIELHGNATYAACLECGERHELEWVRAIFEKDETLPECARCGGIVKTATISFGQSMPEVEMERAREESEACDLFIVLGSSLVVYPAAAFPMLAKRSGARLVIINRDPTDQDDGADLVIHAEIGPTMSRAVGVN